MRIAVISRAVFAATNRRRVKLNVVCHVEIEVSVPIDIAKRCGCPPCIVGKSGGL